MSYVSLYRKYRPESFSGLFGQDHIVRTLINQIKSGNIGHAYLFTGARGTGKTSAAKIFAKAVNCLNPDNGSPCGICEVCQALSQNNNMDILEIDAASNNGVDEIRDLREKVAYPPVHGKYKVYIIDEVHMLSTNAFNALLKTLEEPPSHAIFILATTEVYKLPATILSRLMRFDFRLVAEERIAEHIESIFKDLGKEYDREALLAIAAAGEGSVRDALSIADMCMSITDGKLTYNDVLDALGASERGVILRFAAAILAGDARGSLRIINSIIIAGRSVSVLVKELIGTFRNIMVLCYDEQCDINLPKELHRALIEIAVKSDKARVLRALDIMSLLESEIRYSINPRLLLEASTVKACEYRAELSYDGLLLRINDLENKLALISNRDIDSAIQTTTIKAPIQSAQAYNQPEVNAEPTTIRIETIRERPSQVETQIDKYQAKRIWGQTMKVLREKGMYALYSSGCSCDNVTIEKEEFIASPDSNADYEILSNDINAREITTVIKSITGTNMKFVCKSKQETTGAEALAEIKKLADEDVIKIHK